MEINRHDQLIKQQQLYQKLRDLQDIIAKEEGHHLVLSQELEALVLKRKSKTEEIMNHVQRKTELLVRRDELLSFDKEKILTVRRLKDELQNLNVQIYFVLFLSIIRKQFNRESTSYFFLSLTINRPRNILMSVNRS